CISPSCLLFLFNTTASPDLSTLSLHDALPISARQSCVGCPAQPGRSRRRPQQRHLPVGSISSPGRAHRQEESHRGCRPFDPGHRDRKSTRLNSSHRTISYAVFCLKKKTIIIKT